MGHAGKVLYAEIKRDSSCWDSYVGSLYIYALICSVLC